MVLFFVLSLMVLIFVLSLLVLIFASTLEVEPDAFPAREKHQRQRMRRWSRRWRVVQGRYKAGLRLPLETLRQKANGDTEM